MAYLQEAASHSMPNPAPWTSAALTTWKSQKADMLGNLHAHESSLSSPLSVRRRLRRACCSFSLGLGWGGNPSPGSRLSGQRGWPLTRETKERKRSGRVETVCCNNLELLARLGIPEFVVIDHVTHH